MGMKAGDNACAPLFRECHRRYDASHKEFEERHGVDMRMAAAAYHVMYLKELSSL